MLFLLVFTPLSQMPFSWPLEVEHPSWDKIDSEALTGIWEVQMLKLSQMVIEIRTQYYTSMLCTMYLSQSKKILIIMFDPPLIWDTVLINVMWSLNDKQHWLWANDERLVVHCHSDNCQGCLLAQAGFHIHLGRCLCKLLRIELKS